MLRKGIVEYFQQQAQEVAENLPKVRDHLDEDGIHDLRVGIKKIKSVFELMDYCQQQEQLIENWFPAYHSLFKAAGNIRDLQVEKQLVQKYQNQLKTILVSFTERIEEEIANNEEPLQEEAQKFDAGQLDEDYENLKELIGTMSETMFAYRAMHYARQRFKKVYKHSKKAHKTKKLHKSRTHMKKGFYVTGLLVKYAEVKELDKLTNEASDLASDIGDWHDRFVLLEHVKDYINQKDGLGNLKPYHLLLDTLKQEHKEFMKSGKDKLKDLLSVVKNSGI
jgi:CHAD domain-containing protein